MRNLMSSFGLYFYINQAITIISVDALPIRLMAVV